MTTGNIGNVLDASAVIAVLAIGQLLVILTRGIDLSVGSTLALATVIGALVFQEATVGRWSSARCSRRTRRRGGERRGLRVWPRAASVHRHAGHAQHRARAGAAGSRTAAPSSACPTVGRRHRGRVDQLVAALGVRRRRVAAVAAVLLGKMVWGRWIYAVGGNPEAARRTGIPVRAGAGLRVRAERAARRHRRDHHRGPAQRRVAQRSATLAELDSIAAVIIGGASFLGGRGTVANALVGALMIGVIRNGMNLLERRRVPAADRDRRRDRARRRDRRRARPARGAVPGAPGGAIRIGFAMTARGRRCAARRSASARCSPSTPSISTSPAARCWRCSATTAPGSRR